MCIEVIVMHRCSECDAFFFTSEALDAHPCIGYNEEARVRRLQELKKSVCCGVCHHADIMKGTTAGRCELRKIGILSTHIACDDVAIVRR